MLDIYIILGNSYGEMDSTVNTFGSTQPLGFNFTGTSYAAGATPVMGYKQAILILDYNYMDLDTDVYEEDIPVSNPGMRRLRRRRDSRPCLTREGSGNQLISWLSCVHGDSSCGSKITCGQMSGSNLGVKAVSSWLLAFLFRSHRLHNCWHRCPDFNQHSAYSRQ